MPKRADVLFTPQDPEILARKIKARKEADAIIALAKEAALVLGVDPHHFWVIIIQQATEAKEAIQPTTKPKTKLSIKEALNFETRIVPRGLYAGRAVSEVPDSYWDCWEKDEFAEELHLYLRSDRFRRRVGMPNFPD